MTALVFVDTSVLVYARDLRDPAKQARALDWMAGLWATRAGRLSYQVLQEYYVTVTRKLTPTDQAIDARADVASLVAWQPISVDLNVMDGACGIQDRYGFSWWDALILSAAQVAGCTHVLSEDLQDGQRVGTLVIVNPFQHEPGSLLQA